MDIHWSRQISVKIGLPKPLLSSPLIGGIAMTRRGFRVFNVEIVFCHGNAETPSVHP